MVAIRLLDLRTWSETVPSYALRWRDLELFLFRDEGKIVTACGWRRVLADQLNHISAKRQMVGITFFMPFAGMSAYVGGYDARRRIEVDGLGELAWIFSVCCFVLALWGPPMVASRWWRAERHWDGLELLYLVTTVPFSLVTLSANEGAGRHRCVVVSFDQPAGLANRGAGSDRADGDGWLPRSPAAHP